MAKITGVCVGESLVGDGNEVAHIDLLLGPRGSAVETAFCNALTNNKDGFTTLLAVVAPNLLCKPPTILYNKVTIKDARQAVQMFGPAQYAVAKAVADSVAEGVIPANEADDLYVCVGVFIHWEAKDDKKIQDFNYRATKEAIERAVKGEPKASDVTAQEGLGSPSLRRWLKGRTPRSGRTRRKRWSGPDSAVAAEARFLRKRGRPPSSLRSPLSQEGGDFFLGDRTRMKRSGGKHAARALPRHLHDVIEIAHPAGDEHGAVTGKACCVACKRSRSGPPSVPTRPRLIRMSRSGQSAGLVMTCCGPRKPCSSKSRDRTTLAAEARADIVPGLEAGDALAADDQSGAERQPEGAVGHVGEAGIDPQRRVGKRVSELAAQVEIVAAPQNRIEIGDIEDRREGDAEKRPGDGHRIVGRPEWGGDRPVLGPLAGMRLLAGAGVDD